MRADSHADAATARDYLRLQRPVFCRHPSLFDRWTAPVAPASDGDDPSAPLWRVYSDERHRVGSDLLLFVLLPDGSQASARGVVTWRTRLPRGGPARWDVGLRIRGLSSEDAEALQPFLRPPRERRGPNRRMADTAPAASSSEAAASA